MTLHQPAYTRMPLSERIAALTVRPAQAVEPEAAPRAVAVEPPAPSPIDLGKLEAAVTRKPLNEIAKKIRALTYGEMIELAEAIWKLKPEGEISQEMLPMMLHRWSTGQ